MRLRSPLRTGLFAVGVLAAGLLAPPASSHDSGPVGHLEVHRGTVGPGEGVQMDPDPGEEGPFRAGWTFVLFAHAENGTLTASLIPVANDARSGGPLAATATWTWQAGESSGRSVRLLHDSPHVLYLQNPGATTSSYELYFDMSCSCPGKSIPLPGGFVLFNFDLPARRDVEVGFATISLWHLAAAVAVDTGNGTGAWPDDFRVLTETEKQGAGSLNLTFSTEAAGRYYIFVEALDGVYPDLPVLLSPQLVVEGGERAATSALDAPLALLAVLLALAVSRGLRGGRSPRRP